MRESRPTAGQLSLRHPRRQAISPGAVGDRDSVAVELDRYTRQMESSSVLRIGFLGADATTLAIAQAVSTSGPYEFAGACEIDSGDVQTAHRFNALLGHARRFNSWESLLDLELVDAVVVARGPDEDRRAEQLRKLIQAGVPLLVSHPVVSSMLIYYELDMIRREIGTTVIPYLFDRHHPAVLSMAEMVRKGADSPVGKIDQLVVQRCLEEPTKSAVVAQFARDVDVIRVIGGDVMRLGAMAGGTGDTDYSSLGVQMSGPSGVAARWSVISGPMGGGCQISVLGTAGRAMIHEQAPGQPWTMAVDTGSNPEVQTFSDWNPAVEALSSLDRAIRGQHAEADWVDAARAVELAETIDRSLQKGRTIELYYEDYTEAGTFKGTMASLGCGLLLLGLFLMGAVGIAEQIFGVASTRFWPYLLAGLLGGFLLLQFLLFVSRRREPVARAETPSDFEPPTTR